MAPTKGPDEGSKDEGLTFPDGTPVTSEMIDQVAAAGMLSPEEEMIVRMKAGAGLAPEAEMPFSEDPTVLEIEAGIVERVVAKGILTPDEDGVVEFDRPTGDIQ
jgi:hypothetical protein